MLSVSIPNTLYNVNPGNNSLYWTRFGYRNIALVPGASSIYNLMSRSRRP